MYTVNVNRKSEDLYLLALCYTEKSKYEKKVSAGAFYTMHRTAEQKATSPLSYGS